VILKALNDESLIYIFHVACRYVSGLLATIIYRTGEPVALWQTVQRSRTVTGRRGDATAHAIPEDPALQAGGLQLHSLLSLLLP